jgi:hypothetical protein
LTQRPVRSFSAGAVTACRRKTGIGASIATKSWIRRVVAGSRSADFRPAPPLAAQVPSAGRLARSLHDRHAGTLGLAGSPSVRCAATQLSSGVEDGAAAVPAWGGECGGERGACGAVCGAVVGCPVLGVAAGAGAGGAAGAGGGGSAGDAWSACHRGHLALGGWTLPVDASSVVLARTWAEGPGVGARQATCPNRLSGGAGATCSHLRPGKRTLFRYRLSTAGWHSPLRTCSRLRPALAGTRARVAGMFPGVAASTLCARFRTQATRSFRPRVASKFNGS